MTQTKTKEREAKDKFNQLTDYNEEVLNKIRDHFTPVADHVILQPTVIKKIGTIVLPEDSWKVAPVVTILAVGPDCKVAKVGHKAYLNFPTIGSGAMYEFEVDGKRFLSLMETQLICTFPETIETKEEFTIDNPRLKGDSSLAFQEEKVSTDLILPKSGIIM